MMESGDAMVQRAEICRPRRASVIAVAMVAGLLTLPAGVAAQDGDATPATRTQKTAPANESEAAGGTGEPSHKGDLWERDGLTGDWHGLRSSREGKGLTLGLNYIGEGLGHPAGGVGHGAIYEGPLDTILHLALRKAGGWA